MNTTVIGDVFFLNLGTWKCLEVMNENRTFIRLLILVPTTNIPSDYMLSFYKSTCQGQYQIKLEFTKLAKL